MPVKNMQQPPAGNAREQLKLSVALSDAVTKTCKERGFTVTSAWHTAVVRAVSEIQAAAGETGTTYASFTNYDLRPYFPASFNPRRQPISCYHVGAPLRVTPEGKSFDDISKEIRETYMTQCQPENILVFPAIGKMALQLFASGPPPSSTPVLSSLGIVDRFLSHSFGPHWEVDNIWVADSMLSAEIEAFLWAWKGQIVLSGSFNLAYYTYAEVQDFLLQTKEEMLNGLGIAE